MTADYVGEWGDGCCSSLDEDVVPALIRLARKLDEDGYLSSGQQADLAYYDGAWDDRIPGLPYQYREELIDLVETALPVGLSLDMSCEWVDRCVYVDFNPSYRVALVVPDDQADEAFEQVEDATGEAELDTGGRITVPYEFLQEASDRLDLCGIKYVEVWE